MFKEKIIHLLQHNEIHIFSRHILCLGLPHCYKTDPILHTGYICVYIYVSMCVYVYVYTQSLCFTGYDCKVQHSTLQVQSIPGKLHRSNSLNCDHLCVLRYSIHPNQSSICNLALFLLNTHWTELMVL